MKNKKLLSSESKFLISEQYLRLRLTIFYEKIFFASEIIRLCISVYLHYYISRIYDIPIKVNPF